MRKMMMAAALVAGTATLGSPAVGQLVGGGLVVVNVSDVIDDIAVDLNVSENNIPVTVQVPVSVAAAVCGLDVNVLARQWQDGNRTCDATSTNAALNKFVQKQMRKQ